MTRSRAHTGAIVVLISLLQACGGGGGDGGGSSGGGSDPTLTVSPTRVTVSATPGDTPPPGAVTLMIDNIPREGLHLEAGFTNSGIENISFAQVNENQGNLNILFRSPGALDNGTYTDTIQIRVCTDDQCASQIRGSPVSVTTAYEISGVGISTATFDREAIQLTVEDPESFQRTEQVRARLDQVPPSGTFWSFEHSSNAIQFVELRRPSTREGDISVVFEPSAELGAGIYDDTVTVRICYHPTCVRQVQGSPFTIATNMIVGIGPEPGYEPLAVESRTELAHDIVDAEFSQALRQVVMVGSYPVHALYVYDVATGTEKQQLLDKAPTTLSLAPDGLTAAVGHDGTISVVDLAALAQPVPPQPISLDVSAIVHDLVLDGAGNVHAIEYLDVWGAIHSVHIATNTEQPSIGQFVYSRSRGRLHPSGNYLYTAYPDYVSPAEIEKWDISSGFAAWLYDSPYHGEHGGCGDLWFNESGSRIYTACGDTFRSRVVQSEDMVFSGALRLSIDDSGRFAIRHVSHSAAQNELALIEQGRPCESIATMGPCYSHLGLYEPNLLDRTAVFSIAPVMVDDQNYRQFGQFVFQDQASGKKILLSRLLDMDDPDREFYLSVVP